jgi:acyl carrier protein
MGLDTVELVMEIEEAFDITIPDQEAEKIQTIGQAYHYILARLDGPVDGTARCLSAATFYRLRRKLMGCLRIERRRIRPASALEDLIPAANRRVHWHRLRESLGWKLPDLLRPDWVDQAILGLILSWSALVVLAWGGLTGFAPAAAVPGLLVFLAGTFAICHAVYRRTEPLAIGFPIPEIRGLIPSLLARNLARIRDNNSGGWPPREVWEILITIVADQAGVAPDLLTESTSFVNDLGLD